MRTTILVHDNFSDRNRQMLKTVGPEVDTVHLIGITENGIDVIIHEYTKYIVCFTSKHGTGSNIDRNTRLLERHCRENDKILIWTDL